MIRVAHLVNPFRTPASSEFSYVQHITFETMRRARECSGQPHLIELLTAQFPEDHPIIPDYFTKTADLERSVLDLVDSEEKRKFPLLRDLLGRLYENTTADFLIYTNVDIAVQPHFYDEVLQQINRGLDAFIINRRRIPCHFRSLDELPQMYAHEGLPHPGFDCFVFHRDLYPQFELENVCVGIPFVGMTLAQNLFCFSDNFRLFDHEFLTFHIGEEIFKKRLRAYYVFNRVQFWKAMARIWADLDSRKFPWGDRGGVFKLIKYARHPSIPIRLYFMLEFRKHGLGYINKWISPIPELRLLS